MGDFRERSGNGDVRLGSRRVPRNAGGSGNQFGPGGLGVHRSSRSGQQDSELQRGEIRGGSRLFRYPQAGGADVSDRRTEYEAAGRNASGARHPGTDPSSVRGADETASSAAGPVLGAARGIPGGP